VADKSKCDSNSKVSKTDNEMKQNTLEFEEFFEEWLSEMNNRMESISESEVLTQEDLAVRINVPG
jgi:hypothetical protein